MLRHLIARERTARQVGQSVQSATPPALPRASASPLTNDRTVGTAGTV